MIACTRDGILGGGGRSLGPGQCQFGLQIVPTVCNANPSWIMFVFKELFENPSNLREMKMGAWVVDGGFDHNGSHTEIGGRYDHHESHENNS